MVREGESLRVEKLTGVNKDGAIDFNDVFLVVDGDNVKIGNPVVQGAKVTAKMDGDIRGKKIIVLKYKPKVRYRVKKGHRQNYSKITIEKIRHS